MSAEPRVLSVPDQTVKCTYSMWPGLFLVPFGSIFFFVGIYAMVNHNSIPYRSGSTYSPSSPWWMGLPFFLVGGAVVVGGAYWIMKAKNESISVNEGRLLWIDANKKVKIDCSVEDVIPGSFREKSNGNSSSLLEIQTTKGPIKWYSTIKNCRQLNAIAAEISSWDRPQAAAPSAEIGSSFVCRYRVSASMTSLIVGLILLAAAFVMAFFPGVFGAATTSYIRTMAVPEALFALLYGAPGVYYLLRGLNEEIKVDGEHILWIGPKGNTRLDVCFGDVLPGTFASKKSSSGTDRSFSLGTKAGLLKWTPDIGNTDELNALAHKLSGTEDAPDVRKTASRNSNLTI